MAFSENAGGGAVDAPLPSLFALKVFAITLPVVIDSVTCHQRAPFERILWVAGFLSARSLSYFAFGHPLKWDDLALTGDKLAAKSRRRIAPVAAVLM